MTICTLGIGTAFGESILDNTPRHATIVTREHSELLRIEQKDFKALWEVSSDSFAVNAEKKCLDLKSICNVVLLRRMSNESLLLLVYAALGPESAGSVAIKKKKKKGTGMNKGLEMESFSVDKRRHMRAQQKT